MCWCCGVNTEDTNLNEALTKNNKKCMVLGACPLLHKKNGTSVGRCQDQWHAKWKNRGSSVSIVIRLRAGRPGFDSHQGQGNFFLATASRPALRVHQASYITRIGGSFPWGNAAGGWNWRLTPSTAEVENDWRYTSTPPYVFMAWCLGTGTNLSLPLQDAATWYTFLLHLLHFCSSTAGHNEPSERISKWLIPVAAHFTVRCWTARTMESRVRIPIGAYMYVRVSLCCLGGGLIYRQGNPNKGVNKVIKWWLIVAGFKYEGRLQSSWTHLITPSRKFVEVRWRSLFLSTSLGKWCTSYNATPTSRKRAADRWSLRNFLSLSSLFMVGKDQKWHGARSELNSVFRFEKVGQWNPIRTPTTQSRSRPMRFLGFSNHEKGAPR
jgi:hypothetical protein